MSTMSGNDIVVGVDGSPASLHAALWAARTAARHGQDVTLLSAVDDSDVRPSRRAEELASRTAHARDVLRTTTAHLDHVYPGHPYLHTEIAPGDVAAAVRDRVGAARMVVVGRNVQHIERSTLGATATRLALAGRGVTVVVPAIAITDTPHHVVLALSDEDRQDDLVRYAVEEARLAGCPLRVVHAVQTPALVHALYEDWGAGEPWKSVATSRISAMVTPVAARAGVHTFLYVAEGPVADKVLSQVSTKDVLVVGGRHHHPATARALGSVADRLLRRSPGTVIVVHPSRRDR